MTCSAQLGSSNFAPVGSSFEFKLVEDALDLSAISPVITQSSAENLTWDLSALVPIVEQPYTAEVLEASEGPGFDQMTNANYLVKEVFETGTVRHSYYNLTATEFSRVGSFEGQLGIANIYSDPQIELVFPLDFGTVNEDNWLSSFSFFPLPYNIECIGTGTLLLPGGIVYENLYLIKVLGGGIPAEEFYFFHDGLGVPRASYYPGNFLTKAQQSFRYISAEVLSLSGSEELDLDISYNNPVVSDLRIVFNSEMNDKLDYRLYDVSGKAILSGQYLPNTNVLDIDMQNLKSGIYLISLTSEEGKTMTLKAVKN
jgi:hypothetical protein